VVEGEQGGHGCEDGCGKRNLFFDPIFIGCPNTSSEEPIFDLVDFFVYADLIYCFKIQKLTFPTKIWFHTKIKCFGCAAHLNDTVYRYVVK
jgi:hypothetical protein